MDELRLGNRSAFVMLRCDRASRTRSWAIRRSRLLFTCGDEAVELRIIECLPPAHCLGDRLRRAVGSREVDLGRFIVGTDGAAGCKNQRQK